MSHYLHKPRHVLIDALWLWQLALASYIMNELDGTKSLMDDNDFFWHEGGLLRLNLTIHVDDLLLGGEPCWIKWFIVKLEIKFGKLFADGVHARSGVDKPAWVSLDADTPVLHRLQRRDLTAPDRQRCLDTLAQDDIGRAGRRCVETRPVVVDYEVITKLPAR